MRFDEHFELSDQTKNYLIKKMAQLERRNIVI